MYQNKFGYFQIFRLIDLSDIYDMAVIRVHIRSLIVCLLSSIGGSSSNAIRNCTIWLFAITHRKMKLWRDPANHYPKSRQSALLEKSYNKRASYRKTHFPFKHPPSLLIFSQKQCILRGFCFHHGSITRVLFTYTQHTVINPEPLYGET